MNSADFARPAGRLAEILVNSQAGLAFIPDPLPPNLPVSWKLASLIAEAERALGDLGGQGRSLPNPHLLIGPFMRREAILSSKIEGTETTAEGLALHEAQPQTYDSDAAEVTNYIAALEYGLKKEETLPVGLRLIREIHEKLMSGVRGTDKRPGEFRCIQNHIGKPGNTALAAARFVPPPPEEIQKCLDDLEKFIHTASELPPIVRIALIHYQFETIHPFLDGNGRVGRLLITLLLCVWKVLPLPLLYLSAFFEDHRQAYYDHLLSVSKESTWSDWIEFFVLGVREQAQDAIQRVVALLKLRAEFHSRVRTARSSALLDTLVDSLFQHPAITVRSAATVTGLSNQGAQNNIDKLVAAKILSEFTGRERGRIWISWDIIHLTS